MGSFYNLEIKEIIRETEDAVSLVLKSTNGKPDSFTAGQFLTFLFNEDGNEVRRGYSISSSPDDLPYLRVTIKKVNKDSASTHCIDEARIGQIIKSLPPLGNFVVEHNKEAERDFILFGAGSGITPLFSMLKTILFNEKKSKVVLVYGNRNENSIIFKNEIDELQKKFLGRLNVIHILSQPSAEWQGLKGRITKDFAHKLLLSLNDINLSEANYYICGPGGMMHNVIDALNEHKIDGKKIHRENFEIKIIDEHDNIEEIEREVTIFIKGDKHIIHIKPGESILQKALELGLNVPNSCQIGECGTCRARLLSGKVKFVSQTALSDDDVKEGYCLTCVGYPASDNVVVLYEDPFDD